MGGMVLHPLSRARELLSFWRDYLETAPDELGGAPGFLTAPPAPFVPEHLKGQVVAALLVCYAGSPEQGEEWVRPLKEFGPPEVDLIQPMPYTVVQSLVDPANPPGRRNYWKAENMDGLSDDAIDTMVEHAARMASPFSVVLLEPKGRAISRVEEDEMAIGGRDAAHTVYAFAMWEDPAESDTHVAWAREFMRAMEPYTIPGISLNFSSDQNVDKVMAFFGPEKYERLVALKNEYDPTNLFRLNQNIKPTV